MVLTLLLPAKHPKKKTMTMQREIMITQRNPTTTAPPLLSQQKSKTATLTRKESSALLVKMSGRLPVKMLPTMMVRV